MKDCKYSATIKIGKPKGIKYTYIIGSKTEYKRSSISAKESEGTLEVKISANDITALMASSNYVMKAVKTAESALGTRIPQKSGSAKFKNI